MNLLDRINDDEPDDTESIRVWRPDRDNDCPDAIGGRVLRIGQEHYSTDTFLTLVLVDYEGEQWKVIARHVGLARKLEELDVAVDDELALKFLGSGATREGRFVFKYRVLVEHARGEQPPLPEEEPSGAMADDIAENLAKLRGSGPRKSTVHDDEDLEPF